MGYYPVFLELAARPVLLVGGGHVAAEKLPRLVEAGADITIVAEALSPDVRAYVDGGRATWRQRGYESGDLAGFELLFIANDDGAANEAIAAQARELWIWVNAADDPTRCDFILPSVAQRGAISIATTTGGASPALARWLREQMEAFLSDEVEALAELLADVRSELRVGDAACAATCARAGVPPPLLCAQCPRRIPPERWQQAVDAELRALLRAGDRAGARARLEHALSGDPPVVRA
ncbi:MAG: bifunctional precorrin-2 dehydrogenase/sirohydrochlorin ferrochelatase [Dehalococcoidia bacterium]|nr:bifunctional precorrin-2 dehydrogenase/sirohydrochlorin ferrochelatase [Dehalococcoidia bacterium]